MAAPRLLWRTAAEAAAASQPARRWTLLAAAAPLGMQRRRLVTAPLAVEEDEESEPLPAQQPLYDLWASLAEVREGRTRPVPPAPPAEQPLPTQAASTATADQNEYVAVRDMQFFAAPAG